MQLVIRKKWVLTILAGCCSMAGICQKTDSVSLYKHALRSIKEIRQTSYQYRLHAVFPDNSKEDLNGTVYVDNGNRTVYTDSRAATIPYKGDLYINADHINKTVLVMRLDKRYTADQKKEMERNIFNNGNMDMWLDSFVVRYGILKRLSVTATGTLSAEVGFPAGMTISRIAFVYDTARKQLLSLNMVLKRPWEQNRKKFFTQEISCSNYSNTIDRKKIDTQTYFKISGNKLVLRKYTDYYLNQKI